MIVNRHLAVASAGRRIVAKTLIKEIADQIEEPYTSSKILDVISSSGLSERELNDVSFIFIGADPTNRKLFVQDYLVGETILDQFQKFKYAGSGTFHFLDSIGFKFTGFSGEVNDFEKMTSSLIGRMAVSLYEEITSDIAHNFFYGGGFELLRFDGGREEFVKFPLAFVFWAYDAHHVELMGPIIALNYETGGYLFVHRLARDESKKWRLTTYPVGNFLNEGNAVPTCTRPDFDTFFSVHYLVSRDSDNKLRLMIKKGINKNVCIKLAPNGEELQVDIDRSFLDEVGRMTLK